MGQYPTGVAPEQAQACYTTSAIFLSITWITLLISALFLKRSYDAIADSLNVPVFRTVATFYLFLAATTIIFICFFVLPFAWIFQAVAFFNLPLTACRPRRLQSPRPRRPRR